MGSEGPTMPGAGMSEAGGAFLAKRPMPFGLQRFLAKKGIKSPEDLVALMRSAPRLRWRRPR